MGYQAGQPEKRAPIAAFRLEIEGTDLQCTTVGKLSQELSVIITEIGGNPEIADQTVYKLTTAPVECSRPLTSDTLVEDWWENLKRGVQDKREGRLVLLDTEGVDLYAYPLIEIILTKYDGPEGDAKNAEGENMEMFTLKPRRLGRREALQ